MASRQDRIYIQSDWIEELLPEDHPNRRTLSLRLQQRLNQAFAQINNRLDEMDKPAASVDGKVESFTVEGRQGAFHLTWIWVLGVDGYIIEMFTDSAGTIKTGSWTLRGAGTNLWSIPWGNVASTRYFRITPFIERANGTLKLGTPSSLKSSATVSFGAGESAPTAPTVAPAEYTEEAGLSVTKLSVG